MTQREKASAAVDALLAARLPMLAARGPLREAVHRLRDILDSAQNGPPDGESDGTIEPEIWTAWRKYMAAGEQLLSTLERL